MKTVLVTGGAGYIGSHTCVELIQKGYHVIVVDNFANSVPQSINRIQKITGQTVKYYQASLQDAAALSQIFQHHQIDWVIHFAGFKAVGESVREPLKYYDNNVGGTLVLLRVMQQYGCKKMVFSSSATVYGEPERLPLTEDCRLHTTNPYGTTKLVIENILRDLHQADPSWCLVILRYFNPVGAHQSGLLGEDPRGEPNNLTPYIAQVATGQRPYLRVYGNDYDTPDGTGVRDYIHVCDLATGHVQALEKITNNGLYTYNLGTGKGSSVLDVLHAFEKAVGHPLAYRIEARRPGDIATCYADVCKAQKELGWHAVYDLDAMCRSLWQFYSQNPHGYRE